MKYFYKPKIIFNIKNNFFFFLRHMGIKTCLKIITMRNENTFI